MSKKTGVFCCHHFRSPPSPSPWSKWLYGAVFQELEGEGKKTAFTELRCGIIIQGIQSEMAKVTLYQQKGSGA